jgi:hypothetical protein
VLINAQVLFIKHKSELKSVSDSGEPVLNGPESARGRDGRPGCSPVGKRPGCGEWKAGLGCRERSGIGVGVGVGLLPAASAPMLPTYRNEIVLPPLGNYATNLKIVLRLRIRSLNINLFVFLCPLCTVPHLPGTKK